MKKRIGVVAAGIVLVIVIAIVVMVQINNPHKVVFEDKTMAELIAKNVGVESVDKLRIEDLEKIEILNPKRLLWAKKRFKTRKIAVLVCFFHF